MKERKSSGTTRTLCGRAERAPDTAPELLPEEAGQEQALERAHGALSVLFKHFKKMIFLRRARKKDGEGVFTQAAHGRTKGNSFKGKEKRFG